MEKTSPADELAEDKARTNLISHSVHHVSNLDKIIEQIGSHWAQYAAVLTLCIVAGLSISCGPAPETNQQLIPNTPKIHLESGSETESHIVEEKLNEIVKLAMEPRLLEPDEVESIVDNLVFDPALTPERITQLKSKVVSSVTRFQMHDIDGRIIQDRLRGVVIHGTYEPNPNASYASDDGREVWVSEIDINAYSLTGELSRALLGFKDRNGQPHLGMTDSIGYALNPQYLGNDLATPQVFESCVLGQEYGSINNGSGFDGGKAGIQFLQLDLWAKTKGPSLFATIAALNEVLGSPGRHPSLNDSLPYLEEIYPGFKAKYDELDFLNCEFSIPGNLQTQLQSQ